MNERNSGQSNLAAIIVIFLIIVGGAVFALTRNNQTENTVTPTQQNNSQTNMSSVSFDLLTQSNSRQTGKVTITDEGGKTKVLVEMTPASSQTQPAHIHSGDCTIPGAVKYPLNNVVNGRSETVLTPSMHFIHGVGQLIINVHKSTTEPNIYSACGDLTAAFNQAMHTGN